MGRIVCYRGTTGTTGTGAGLAASTILNKGIIRGWSIRARASGGGGNGFYSMEVGVNQGGTSNAEQSGTNRLTTLGATTYCVASGGIVHLPALFMPTNWPVNPGDVFTINQTQTGTAAASLMHCLELFVEETV